MPSEGSKLMAMPSSRSKLICSKLCPHAYAFVCVHVACVVINDTLLTKLLPFVFACPCVSSFPFQADRALVNSHNSFAAVACLTHG